MCRGEDDEEDGTLDLTWSQTNSSSETSSRASGEGEAYLCIVSIKVDIYRRFASVRERPDDAFHASLPQISDVLECQSNDRSGECTISLLPVLTLRRHRQASPLCRPHLPLLHISTYSSIPDPRHEHTHALLVQAIEF